MSKKYRVISQAAPVAGKSKLDVHKALLKMNLKPEQAQLLLLKPLVIKKGLDNQQALEYAERFSAAGLRVKVESYEVAEPPTVTSVEKQRDDLYKELLRTFANPLRPAGLEGPPQYNSASAILAALPAPALYLLLVAFTAGLLLWYLATGHAALFSGLDLPEALATPIKLVTLVLPSLAGVVLLAFLLSPFWPRPAPQARVALEAKSHARFHHLISQVTAAMDVAAPEHIEISPSAQISVQAARGIFSTRRGDLRLVIGLSAVAGMKVDEFMAVVAQQFGRFSSPSASAASIWTESINHWLAEQTKEGGHWDERLNLWRESYNTKLVHLLIGAAKSLRMLVRKLFAGLLELNRKTTGGRLKDIGASADLYLARVVGSSRFAATRAKHKALRQGVEDIYALNHAALYQREQLLTNIPAAVAEITQSTETASAPAVETTEIESLQTAAMLNCDPAAQLLFEEFDKLCEAATLRSYHRRGISDADRLLVANQNMLADRQAILTQARVQAIAASAPSPIKEDGTVDWPGDESDRKSGEKSSTGEKNGEFA